MTTERAGESILVTGAAGKTGQAVIAALVDRGAAVRALVRRPEQRGQVAQLGVSAVAEGDLVDPKSLAEAAAGTGTIYHICPNVHPEEVAIGRNVIEAARSAGARRIVFHSVLHPQIEAMPHHWAKLRVEEMLFKSGLGFTILQPAPYMQNVLAQRSSIVERGVYPVPYSLDTRVSMVDLRDVAEAAARVLLEPGHDAATYELCSPDLLDQREVAEVLGRALGRAVRAEAISREAWAERAGAAAMGAYPRETLLAMFRYYERYGMAGGSTVLAGLLEREPSCFEEFASRLATKASDGS
jgi:uncharacterized protein YbjT (DUF2867 family)